MLYFILHPKKAIKQFILNIIEERLKFRDKALEKHLKDNYNMIFDLISAMK